MTNAVDSCIQMMGAFTAQRAEVREGKAHNASKMRAIYEKFSVEILKTSAAFQAQNNALLGLMKKQVEAAESYHNLNTQLMQGSDVVTIRALFDEARDALLDHKDAVEEGLRIVESTPEYLLRAMGDTTTLPPRLTADESTRAKETDQMALLLEKSADDVEPLHLSMARFIKEQVESVDRTLEALLRLKQDIDEDRSGQIFSGEEQLATLAYIDSQREHVNTMIFELIDRDYEVSKVPGDGNCLFASAERAGSGIDLHEARLEVTEEMRSNSNAYLDEVMIELLDERVQGILNHQVYMPLGAKAEKINLKDIEQVAAFREMLIDKGKEILDGEILESRLNSGEIVELEISEYDRYVAAMRCDCVWAGTTEIKALQAKIDRPILLVTEPLDGAPRYIRLFGQPGENPLVIRYNGENHYDAYIMK